jgi:hypothetical protein
MSDLFGNLQPLYNPIGFGASDFILLAWAVLLVLLLAAGLRFQARLRGFAARTRRTHAGDGCAAGGSQAGDAGAGAGARPAHAGRFRLPALLATRWRTFAWPTRRTRCTAFSKRISCCRSRAYSSIYPLGQGIALAFGQIVFGDPWVGVLLAAGLFSALCYWMLRGWTSPGWALAGGLMTVMPCSGRSGIG